MIFFKKFKKRIKWLLIIIISILIIFFAISSSLKIDVGNILFGIAAIGLVYVLYQYLEYKKQPQKTVVVSAKADLITPILKFNRYKFHVKIEHEITDKDERRIITAEEFNIKFKKSEHPNLYPWCHDYAMRKFIEHKGVVSKLYPNANINYIDEPELNIPEEINNETR